MEYKREISDRIDDIIDGIKKDGGLGLALAGVVIGYNPVIDTYISFKYLDEKNEDYRD